MELDTDVLVAWERTSDHENQVDGIVINIPMSGPISQPAQLVPLYHFDSAPRLQADSVSDTVGFAAKPELAVSYYGTFLAWMDDGTFTDDGRSSAYILSRYRDTTPGPYVMQEFEPLDASGRGLSRTGGVAAFRSLRRGESLTESFVYRVNNFIYEAEAVVTFRVVGDNRWHNSRNPFDVDDDQGVSPLDVLSLINDINVFGVRELPDNSQIGTLVRFLDVDDDGTLSPLDVLLVINWLNMRSTGGGEGESAIDSRSGPNRSPIEENWGEFDGELSYMPIELVWDVAKKTKNRMSRSIS